MGAVMRPYFLQKIVSPFGNCPFFANFAVTAEIVGIYNYQNILYNTIKNYYLCAIKQK